MWFTGRRRRRHQGDAGQPEHERPPRQPIASGEQHPHRGAHEHEQHDPRLGELQIVAPPAPGVSQQRFAQGSPSLMESRNPCPRPVSRRKLAAFGKTCASSPSAPRAWTRQAGTLVSTRLRATLASPESGEVYCNDGEQQCAGKGIVQYGERQWQRGQHVGDSQGPLQAEGGGKPSRPAADALRDAGAGSRAPPRPTRAPRPSRWPICMAMRASLSSWPPR